MKKLCAAFLAAVIFSNAAFADMMDVAYWTSKEAGQKLREARDEIYQDSMVSNIVNTVGQLEKNYQQAVQFANEMKQYQQNPSKLLQDNINAFNQSFGDPAADLKARIAQAENRESYLDQLHNKVIKAETKFADNNLSVAEYVKEKVDEHNKMLQKAANDMASGNKNTVESGKNLAALTTATAIVNIETAIANFLQMTANQQKQLANQQAMYMIAQSSYTATLRGVIQNLKYFNTTDRKSALLDQLKQQPGQVPMEQPQ